MCLISYGPLPDQAVLEDAADTNADGIGIAYRTPKGVEWQKDLSVKDLLALPSWIKEKVAVHFRLATVGGKTKELIHPFPIEPDVRLEKEGRASRVLMHNGHISRWDDYLKCVYPEASRKLKGPMSDSRAAAWLVWKMGADILYFLYGSRYLIMSKHRTHFYGEWVQDGDRWYSNHSFKWKRQKRSEPTYQYGCHDYGKGGYYGAGMSDAEWERRWGRWKKEDQRTDNIRVTAIKPNESKKPSVQDVLDSDAYVDVNEGSIWYKDEDGVYREHDLADITGLDQPTPQTQKALPPPLKREALNRDELKAEGWDDEHIDELIECMKDGIVNAADAIKKMAEQDKNKRGPAPLGDITKDVGRRIKEGWCLLKGGGDA